MGEGEGVMRRTVDESATERIVKQLATHPVWGVAVFEQLVIHLEWRVAKCRRDFYARNAEDGDLYRVSRYDAWQQARSAGAKRKEFDTWAREVKFLAEDEHATTRPNP